MAVEGAQVRLEASKAGLGESVTDEIDGEVFSMVTALDERATPSSRPS